MGLSPFVRRALSALVVAPLTVALVLALPAPAHAAKLFVTLSQPHGELPAGPILRYDVPGQSSGATLETTIDDPSFDNPLGIVFGPNGDMLVTNRADQFHGSISRISNAQGVPVFRAPIASPAISGPHFPTFRGNELFIPQLGGSNVIRFVFDANGAATFNGAFTTNLCCDTPRAAVVSPGDELFVSQCCLQTIQRYLFDAAGNVVPHGRIVDSRLTNPHRMVFAPWGELFVAQDPGVWGGKGNVYRFLFDAHGNAVPNGVVETGDALSLTFSPWGELFVGLVGEGTPGVSRWTFDANHTAHPNGVIATPQAATEVAFGPPTAPPRTVRVDDDKAQCPHAKFKTIARALAAVPPGSTIVVCPGQYSGPLNMTKPGVRVMGLTGKRSDVVVLPPARFNDTGVVEMSAPATTLANLTIRDRDPLTCFGLGVVVDNGAGPFAEASLIENVTVRMDFASVSECAFFADGTGVKIGGREAGAVPGRAVVHRSTIMGRSEGVEVFAGSTAGIRHNVIARLFGAANQSDGAVTMEGGTARVVRNDLSGYSAGVLLFHGGHVLIGGPGNGNEIHDSIVGVTLIGGDSEGVRATVADNDIHHNESSGVFVETPDAVVARNRIRDNGSTGISLTSTASGNRILHNVATGNDAGSPGAVDCSDESTGTGTAGTANTWIGNIGGSSSPPGIC